jgi:glycosyltransferase involved in cell wall biosynthesis
LNLDEGVRQANPPVLTVVVPVHNGRLHLSRCLEALRDSEYTRFELIVVDDCSTDNTRAIVERYGARYLRTSRTLGPSGARNLGVRCAQGGVVVFVDADVVVPPSALGLIAGEFEQDPELAALFGSYDREPAWGNFLSQYKNLMHHYIHQTSNEAALSFWAGCGAVRKDIFEKMGGFDAQKYPEPAIEDIELGLKIVKAGLRIRLNKQLQVKHLKRWSVRGLLRADILRRAVPWTRLILKTRHLPRDLNLNYASRASALLVGLLIALLGVAALVAAGLIEGFSIAYVGLAIAAVVVVLFVLNRDIYIFFARLRGWRFATRAVLAHWFYYLYSSAAFFACCVEHVLRSAHARGRLASGGARTQE